MLGSTMASEAITNMLNNPDLLTDPSFLFMAGVASLAVVGVTSCLLKGKKEAPPPPKAEEEVPAKEKGKAKAVPQKKGKQEKSKPEKKVISVDHPLWISSSSAGGEIVGFAYNGHDICATTSDDHQICVFDHRHQERQITKLKDNGSMLAMNDTYLAAFISYSDSFHLYQLHPNKGNVSVKPEFVLDFPKNKEDKHKKDIICMELSKNSKFMVTHSDDTIVKVWSTSGNLLGQFNTSQMINKMARISPDSRFICVAAFTSDVRLWEVVHKKTGEYDSIAKVMDLRGHNTGVNCVSFTADSTRIYTGAKDGIWRAYRINVRYAMNEDPVKEKQVQTGSPINKMEVSPDGKTLAIIDKRKVQFWDTASGTAAQSIDFATIIENCGDIRWFVWAEDSKRFVTVMGNIVYFWRSPI
eukprot:Phypoly_transcript_08274.p1 GENE.Phypoly_transcript_08274~~Phypoly_transcript_08274.p1  ORF type:complete len:412 (+),score=75.55 Phypoly_transcript_08274:79-1314(+)